MPWALIIHGNIRYITHGIARMEAIARYLPITILNRLTGDVKSSWSVLLFLSSAKLLIVRMGIAIMNTKRIPDKT